MVDVPALETDATAIADVAGGDDATIATASNGRQTPSMLKVIKDQIRWKPPILYTGSILITDVLQPFTSGIDGFVYAPAPGKVPFTAAVDPSTDPTNWFLVQGYAQGSGADLDFATLGSIINLLNLDLSGVLISDSTLEATSTILAAIQTDGGIAAVKQIIAGGGILLGGVAAGNLLDDYEEGSWTPVVADASSAGNIATATVRGRYTKIGDTVYITGEAVNIDTTGLTGANTIHIQGLPFVALEDAYGTVRVIDMTLASAGIFLEQQASLTALRFRMNISSSSNTNLNVQDLTSTTADFFFSYSYKTS